VSLEDQTASGNRGVNFDRQALLVEIVDAVKRPEPITGMQASFMKSADQT